MNTSKRQWKQTADEAMSPVHFSGERDRLALEIGAHIAGWPSMHALGTLQGRVLGLIEDAWIRAWLAAKRLDTLHDSLESADYEDIRSTREELLWTEAYLAPALDGLVAHRHESSASYTERLIAAFAAQIAPGLETVPAARAS